METNPTMELPLHPTMEGLSAEELALLRSVFREHNFTWKSLCERLGAHPPAPSLGLFESPQVLADLDTPHMLESDRPALDWLLKLFVLGEDLNVSPLQDALGEDVFGVLVKTRLVDVQEDVAHSNVFLSPWNGFVVAADRVEAQRIQDAVAIQDPATAFMTDFMELEAGEPCLRALDIGVGAGVLALLMTRWFDAVDAVDVNARAVEFTRFNAALNGVSINAQVCDPRLSSLSRPDGGYDLVTFAMPLAYPYFHRGYDALWQRSELGEMLIVESHRALVRLLSERGRGQLWHQILIDPPNYHRNLLEGAGVTGLDIVLATMNLQSSAWSFSRSLVTRNTTENLHLEEVGIAGNPFTGAVGRRDIERAKGVAPILTSGVGALMSAVPKLHAFVSVSEGWKVTEGRLAREPMVWVRGIPFPSSILMLLQQCDGETSVGSIAKSSPQPSIAVETIGRLAAMGLLYF